MEFPADGNTNYVSMAAQVPLSELLRRVPKGLQLGLELRNTDGTVYGHSHTPLGIYCHDAAYQLEKMQKRLNELRHIALKLDGASINTSVILALTDLEGDPFDEEVDEPNTSNCSEG